MAVNEEVLLDIKVQNQDALNNIEKLSAANDKLKGTLLDIKKAVEAGQITDKDAASTRAVLNAQIKENTSGIRENSKEIKTNAASVASAGDSINGMRVRVTDLQKSYNSLSASAREGSVGRAISAEMLQLNTNVNKANLSVGNFKDNIGNYAGTLGMLPKPIQDIASSAEQTLGIFSKGFGGLKSATDEYIASIALQKEAQAAAIIADEAATSAELELSIAKAAGTATSEQAAAADSLRATATAAATVATETGTGAMKLFKVALASTGIGLIVIALGALVSYFTSTNEGAKQFQRVMSGVNAVIQEGVKFMGSLGKLIVDVLTGNVKELGNDVKNIGDNWKNASGNIEKNYELGNKIADQRQKLTKAEREFSNEKIRQQGIIDVLALKIRQSDLSPAERKKAADQTLKIDNELHQKEMYFANENLRIVQLEQSVKSKKDLQAIQDAKNRVTQTIAEDNRFEQSVKNRVGRVNNTLAKAADTKEAREIKSTQTILNERGKVLDNENKTELILEENYNKRTEKIKKLYTDEISLIDKQSSFEKWTSDKIEAAKAVVFDKERKRLEDIATIRTNLLIDQMQKELKIIQLQEDEKTVIGGKTFQMQKDDLQRNYNASVEQNRLKLENDKNYVDQSDLINQQFATDSANLDNSISENRKQLWSNDIENQLTFAASGLDRETELKKQALDIQRINELKNANLTATEKENINKKYAKAERDLDRMSLQTKLSIASSTANSLAEIFGKTTQAGKVAASIGITIDSIAGSIKAFNSMAEIPVVGPALGVIAADGVIATGVQAVKQVWAVSESGTSTVPNTSSPVTSVATPGSSTIYTNLPTISSMYGSNASQNETAQIIAQSVPNPVVSVTEITTMQNVVSVKENSKL